MIDPAELEGLAAEYVLGTLDAQERTELDRLRRSDVVLDRQIREWEDRLRPLLESGYERTPNPELRATVLARLRAAAGQTEGGQGAQVLAFRRRVTFWRSATAAASLIAAALALWIVAEPMLRPVEAPKTYLAVLDQGPDHASFVVSLDLARHKMTVAPSSTAAQAGKDYELWMIGADQTAPISLGVLDTSKPVSARWPGDDPNEMKRATYAVTLEVKGGSPTGQPTSKPIFVGHVIDAGSL